MRIYHFKFKMNSKSIFVLILTVLVIFGYSFYRYFYRHEYYLKSSLKTISSGKDFERKETDFSLTVDTWNDKERTTQKPPTKEMPKTTETRYQNFESNSNLREKAKNELLKHFDELSRQGEQNLTNSANESIENDSLSDQDEMEEQETDGFLNNSKILMQNKSLSHEDDEDEDAESGETKHPDVTNLHMMNKTADTMIKNVSYYNFTNLMQNENPIPSDNPKDYEDFALLLPNTTQNDTFDIRFASESLAQSNYSALLTTNQYTKTSYPRNLKSKSRKVSPRTSPGASSIMKIRRKPKRNKKTLKNILKGTRRNFRSKIKRRGHHRARKTHKPKKPYKGNIVHKSSQHEAGHNGQHQQHKSIYPNKKMLMALKSNTKLDYKEGYVLNETFFREVKLKSIYSDRKTSVLLLHPSAFTSSVWVNIGTMQTLAESGYHNVAIDLPGYGRSTTAQIPYSRNEIIGYMIQLLGYLGLKRPVIVTPSRSGDYMMPLVMSHPYKLSGFVAISPTDTGKYSRRFYENLELPSLVVLGRDDTSMLNWASLDNLEHLKVKRIYTIANASNECYVDQPLTFHKLLLEFLRSLHAHPYFRHG